MIKCIFQAGLALVLLAATPWSLAQGFPARPVKPHIKAGKLRALATTSATRPSSAADIPTLDEAGLKGYEADTWYGLFAPAGTPDAILDKIHADLLAVLNLPEIRNTFAAQGAEIVGSSRKDFTLKVRQDVQKWQKVIQQLKLRID